MTDSKKELDDSSPEGKLNNGRKEYSSTKTFTRCTSTGSRGAANYTRKNVTVHAKPANELDKREGSVRYDHGNESLVLFGFCHTSVGHVSVQRGGVHNRSGDKSLWDRNYTTGRSFPFYIVTLYLTAGFWELVVALACE